MTGNSRVNRPITRLTLLDPFSEPSECLDSALLAGTLQNIVGTALLEDTSLPQGRRGDLLVQQDRPDYRISHLRKTATEKVFS